MTELLQIGVVHNCAENVSFYVAAPTQQWRPWVLSGKWQIGLTPAPPKAPPPLGAGHRRIISCSKSDLQFIIFGFKNRSLSRVPRPKLIFSHNYQVLEIRFATFGILRNLSCSHNKGLKRLHLTEPFKTWKLASPASAS